MSYTPETIRVVVNEHVDSIKEKLADKIYQDLVKCAVENNKLETVKNLVEKGANIKSNDLLQYAAKNGHLEMVEYLVEKGAIINGFSLEYAAKNGHLEIIKYLVRKNANVVDTCSLKYAVENCHPEMVKILVKNYLDRGLAIPDNVITKQVNDAHKVLFLYASLEQHHLFHDDVITPLISIKKLII